MKLNKGPLGACGKQSFTTKKAAARYGRKLHPDAHLNAYPCGNYFHYGNLPVGVSRGIYTRADLRPKASRG